MPLNIPTFLTRTASAIVFAAIMLTGLLWNELSFGTLCLLIQFLCLREYFFLMKKIKSQCNWPRWFYITMQIVAFLFLYLFLNLPYSNVVLFYFFLLPVFILPLLPLLAIVILIIFLATSSKERKIVIVFGLLGLIYVTLPITVLAVLHNMTIILPLAIILMIWINDTMAYIVWSFIGKTQLSKISPKKTWEGTVGGAILTIGASAIYGYYSHIFIMTDCVIMAVLVTIFGTLGDLFESKLKRLAGVKDSGKLMPGHGGALDRFDSLLIATPFAFLYVFFFMTHTQAFNY
jgi:phosphatidate cytidylyltransferase